LTILWKRFLLLSFYSPRITSLVLFIKNWYNICRRLKMRRKKFLLFVLAIIFMVMATPAMGQSAYADCSQKYLVKEPPPLGSGSSHYRRRVVFPWYAVGPVPGGGRWETRLVFGLSAVPAPPDFLGGNYFINYLSTRKVPAWNYAPLLKQTDVQQQPHFTAWAGGTFGNFLRLGSRMELVLSEFAWRIQEGDNSYPSPTNDLDVGVVVLDFYTGEKSDPCIVNKLWDNFVYAQLTFVSRRPDGTVEWQVSEPGYFVDQLSPRWAAPINVSGAASDPPDFIDFEDPSFAVANAGDKEVRVRISLFEQYGEPHEGYNYPSWQKTITLGPMRTEGHVIRQFFGEDVLFKSIYPGSNYGGRPSGFRGTILFEAVDASENILSDAKIIPLVIQRVGDSLTNVQLVKLPPVKPTW
jgi:hypothetical protein